MSQKGKHIAGSILLLIFMAYYVNITFFTHSHIINGVTIVHSHFHDKTHTQTGGHNGSELTLISKLSTFQSLSALSFLVAPIALFFLIAIIRIFCKETTASDSIAYISLRAPPSLY